MTDEEIERRRKEIEAMVAPVMNQADPQGQAIKAEAGRRIENAIARGEPVRSSASFGQGSTQGTPATDFGNTRAVDYAQRGLPTGNTLQGDSPPVGLDNPQTGFYTNQTGENLGNVQPGQSSPTGATGIQGVLSPQEQAFWGANPNGAVKDPTTGKLIGLGAADTSAPQEPVAGLGTTDTGRRVIPNFIQIPEINPSLAPQREQIQNEIAATQNELRGASSFRIKGQPSQREVLRQKLNDLTESNNSLGMEHYRQTEAQRKATDQNRELQDKYVMHHDVMDANKAISKITAPKGTPEWTRQMFEVTDKYEHAMDDTGFRKRMEDVAFSGNEREEARQRAREAGYIPQVTGYNSKGPTEKYVPADPLKSATEKATQKEIATTLAKGGVTMDQFAQRGKVERGNADEKGQNFKNADDGTHMKVTVGAHTLVMPVGRYEQLNTAIPSTQPQQGAVAAPAAVPPPEKREANATYDTPKGKMKWTGTGWVNP